MMRPECAMCRQRPSSGLWALCLKGGDVLTKPLCADCGLTKAIKKIRMFEDKHTGEMVCYRYVERVELLMSFTREATPDEAGPAPLSKGAQALLAKKNRERPGHPTLHRNVTDRKDWSYRGPTWLDRQLEIPED